MAAMTSAKRHRGHDPWCISPSHASELSGGPQYLKLLVGHNGAGVLIGRNGADLQSAESATGCRIKVSSKAGVYPGTSERVIALAGGQLELAAGIDAVMEACSRALQLEPNEENHTTVRVVIPSSAAGLVIGKKGAVQKELVATSGVPLEISKTGQNMIETERVVSLTGSVDAVSSVVHQVSQLIQGDPNMRTYLETPTAESLMNGVAHASQMAQLNGQPPAHPAAAGPASLAPQGGKGGKGGKSTLRPPAAQAAPQLAPAFSPLEVMMQQAWMADPMQQAWQPNPMQQGFAQAWGGQEQASYGPVHERPCTISFRLGDYEAAHVIGKAGAFQKTIEQQTGIKIQISKRGEAIPELAGTSDRMVTIVGPMQNAHMAHEMALQRASEVVQQ